MTLPDHSIHMAEVKALGETARETVEPTQSQAPVRGLFAPLHLAPADGIPHEYILHIHTQLCTNCACGEQHSEFFAYYRLRSRMGGNVVSHLRRCDRPLYDLPVRRVPLSPTKVPFCSECEGIDLSHLPPPPLPSNLTDLPDVKLKGAKPVKPQAPKATLEDLI